MGTVSYSENPDLQALVERAFNVVKAKALAHDRDSRTSCGACGARDLVWTADLETGIRFLKNRKDNSLHSCPQRRLPVNSFKESTWRRKPGRLK